MSRSPAQTLLSPKPEPAEVNSMARLLAALLVLGVLAVYLTVHTQGVDRAFGGALARFARRDATPATAYPEPSRRPARDWWEVEDRPPPQGVGQRVRERVNEAMETGARRHGGE